MFRHLADWLDIEVRRHGMRWHRGKVLPPVPLVVDVGIGRQGTKPLYRLFPSARYVLIDPLEECRAAVRDLLRDPANAWVTTALGEADGTATLHVTRNLSESTLLTATAAHDSEDATRTREITVRRLDEVLDGIAPDGPLGLKVDTEGYELKVLAGAPRTLARAAWVILEVDLQERFDGAPSFEDTVFFMREAGFRVRTVLYAGTRKCDLAFIRA